MSDAGLDERSGFGLRALHRVGLIRVGAELKFFRKAVESTTVVEQHRDGRLQLARVVQAVGDAFLADVTQELVSLDRKSLALYHSHETDTFTVTVGG
jgi:hypothetical protein